MSQTGKKYFENFFKNNSFQKYRKLKSSTDGGSLCKYKYFAPYLLNVDTKEETFCFSVWKLTDIKLDLEKYYIDSQQRLNFENITDAAYLSNTVLIATVIELQKLAVEDDYDSDVIITYQFMITLIIGGDKIRRIKFDELLDGKFSL